MSSIKQHVSELSPQEFQKTFPIILKGVQPVYADWYEEEKTSILGVIDPKDIVRINHIGSSAIPNIKAKPVVDILLELDGTCNVDNVVDALKSIGFGTEVCIKKDNPFEYLLAKGMTVKGFDEKVLETIHIDKKTGLPQTGPSDSKPQPIVNRGPKVGRNDLCPCGSGKKYKNCCGK